MPEPKRIAGNTLVAASLILAASGLSTPIAAQPGVIDLGGFEFTPSVTVEQVYDDNLFLQEGGSAESGWITKVRPRLTFSTDVGPAELGISYVGDYGKYWGSSQDNYDNHSLAFDIRVDERLMHGLDFDVGYSRRAVPRGEGAAQGPIADARSEPDVYDQANVGVTWSFNQSGRIGFRIGGTASDLEYQNNRIETQFLDRSSTGVQAAVTSQVAPNTRVFLEAAQSEIDYDQLPLFGDTLDSEESRLSVGVEWELTARTTGSARFGRTDKDFDALSREDIDQASWDVSLSWAPRTYSVFTFTTFGAPQETNGFGRAIDSSNYSVAWSHQWPSQLSTNVTVQAGADDYVGDVRKDDRVGVSVGANYKVYRWLRMNFGFEWNERSSNTAGFDFQQRKATFGLTATL